MKNPSMAGVMAAAVGPWGGALMNLGLIVSVGGALLAWTMLAAEMLYLAGRGDSHTAPAVFGRLNAAEAPASSLWLTNSLVAVLLVINCINNAGYNLLIQLASSLCLIPYFLCAAFGLKTATRPGTQAGAFLVTSAVATLYGAWLIYAGGLSFLLMSMILYAPGIAFFVYARRERGLPAFVTGVEKGFAGLIVTLALVALYMIASGQLAL